MEINTITKKELRGRIREKRRSMTAGEIAVKSRVIMEKLFSMPQYQKASRIYAYVSHNQEVSTLEFMEQVLREGKVLLVPKVHGDIMKYYEITSLSQLSPGAYGIYEPDTRMPDTVSRGFMLLPGLAFDKEGYRLGYGGGFYDKYLSANQGHFKVGLAYDFQVVERLPRELHDIAADAIVTEGRIIV